jgi:hypothetical protein
MPMKPPVLLCYNLPEEKRRKVRLLAMRLTVRVRPVEPAEYGQPLAALCGLEPLRDPAPQAQGFAEEMLVLAHFPPDLLNRFLYGMRKDGIAPVALKAVLTETNQSWDSAALRDQLAAEHEALQNGQPPVHDQPQG